MSTKVVLGAILNYAVIAVLLLLVPGSKDAGQIAMGLIGSNIGCMFGIAWFTPAHDTEENTLRRLCLKLGGSNSIGLVVGRMEDEIHSLVVSMGAAMLVVGVIHAVVLWIERDRDDG